MKQVSNSLLTLFPIPFNAFPNASAFPRDTAGANGRRYTPFYIRREEAGLLLCALPGLSCSPRSVVRIGLGEGRIRNLLRRICLVLCIVIPCAQAYPAANRLIVDLKEDAAIPADVVRLGDVADVRGSDSAAVARLSQVDLGPSPEFGIRSALTRQQIYLMIQRSISGVGIFFSGAAVVRVSRQGILPDANEILMALKNHILSSSPWKESEIDVQLVGNLKGIELPADGVQLRMSPDTALVGKNRILASIEAVREGKTFRSFWVTAEISIHAPIVVASRKIPFDKVLSAEDIAEAVVDIPDMRTSYVRQRDDLIGKVSRRSFPPGAPLTRESFTEPILVRHGETVRLCLEREGIVLTTLAKAEQNGRLGQIISIRNLEFSTSLKATVTGRGAVRIQ